MRWTNLHTGYPYANMGSLNHADVIGTVANREQRGFGTPLDEFDN